MINNTFKDQDNCYIVLAAMKKFCKNNNLNVPQNRSEAINMINKFSNESSDNMYIANDWINTVLKEGMKHIYLRKVTLPNSQVRNEVFWKKFINNEFEGRDMRNVNEPNYSETLEIQNIKLNRSDKGIDTVSIYISLFIYEYKMVKLIKSIYPIFVDIDINNNLIIIRLKSKVNIYNIKSNSGELNERLGDKINLDLMAEKILKMLKSKIGFEEESVRESKHNFYKSYYKFLKYLTQTPSLIKDKIKLEEKIIKSFIQKVFSDIDVSTIIYEEMAIDDLNVFLEKFISISIEDKDFFIKGKDGYPIKLIATDSEDTTISETAGDFKSLQTKPSFYDHKKILDRQKLCDGMSLAYNRIDTLYFGSKPYQVRIQYKKGFGIIIFKEYVEEGDIQNVLSRVIENL